ncbi:SDR family oxidoreductase [Phenylobacterium sp. LjRoot219]|uniref:SDR family oxidoreductase n=1 Tax=Phenylobacterium sp. LjRoot219 TaxID=3342283 RepID=UPI003ECDB0C0
MANGRPATIVTGAYGGMGRACARQLGRRADLVLCDLDEGRLETFAESLREEGYTVAATVAGDLSQPGLAQRAVDAARAAGPLQAVAHTAGVSPSLGAWDVILRANVIATERLLVALEADLERGLAVVLISSMAGHMTPARPAVDALLDAPLEGDLLQRLKPHLDGLLNPTDRSGPSRPAYGVSKRWVIRMCEARAPAWGRSGARIVSVSPGLMWTPMGRAEADGNPDAAVVGANTPVGRWGTALDIADAVDFLTSERAAFISGTDLRVDGAATPGMRGVAF